jgi:hypothetical protein
MAAQGGRVSETPAGASGPDDDGVPPLFGSWRAIYLSVVVCAVLTMGAIAVFSNWPW